jgi:hypothetical protein
MGSSLTFKIFTITFFLASLAALLIAKDLLYVKKIELSQSMKITELEIQKATLEIQLLDYQIKMINGDL